MKNAVFWSIVLFLVGGEPAYAYIDPGSGSAIMSVIIGFFVAIGVLIKTFWYKIKGFLGLSKTKKESTSDKASRSNQDRDGK